MERTVVIIPTLNPLRSLIKFVESLMLLAIDKVIIINDGSDEKYKKINSFKFKI